MGDKVYYSTGRGGAGNIQSSSQAPSPKLVPKGSNTPQLHNEFVTTGRGGLGNMVKNDDANLTRKLQDVDQPDIHPVTSGKSFIGRGGYGNIINSAPDDNLYSVTSSGPEDGKDKKGFFSKVASFFASLFGSS